MPKLYHQAIDILKKLQSEAGSWKGKGVGSTMNKEIHCKVPGERREGE